MCIKGTLLHGSNLRVLECQYLEKRGPKIQDYVISCNSNITSFVFYSTTDYIPNARDMASLLSDSATSMQARL